MPADLEVWYLCLRVTHASTDKLALTWRYEKSNLSGNIRFRFLLYKGSYVRIFTSPKLTLAMKMLMILQLLRKFKPP